MREKFEGEAVHSVTLTQNVPFAGGSELGMPKFRVTCGAHWVRVEELALPNRIFRVHSSKVLFVTESKGKAAEKAA
jgi:hypothetical protein